jgi:hypothetical protein
VLQGRGKVWMLYALPVVTAVMGFILWRDLTRLEEEGGTYRTHRLVVALYNAGGKKLVVGAFAVIAVIYAYALIQYRKHARAIEKHEDEHEARQAGHAVARPAPTPIPAAPPPIPAGPPPIPAAARPPVPAAAPLRVADGPERTLEELERAAAASGDPTGPRYLR